MIIKIGSPNGLVIYDTDLKTLQQMIDEGYESFIDGNLVSHKLNIACMTQNPPNVAQLKRLINMPNSYGCMRLCDAHQWTLCREICVEAVDGITFLQEDCDLVHSILPIEG